MSIQKKPRTPVQSSARIVKKVLYVLGLVVLLPLSCLIPKNKRYVVLTSRFGDFEGNLKYFFIYLNNLQDTKYDFIFLTRKKEVYRNLKSMGYLAWFYPSIKTAVKLLRAKCLIVDGNEWAKSFISLFLSTGKKVQIWHGTGLKTIGLLKPKLKGMSKFQLKFRKENTFYHLLSLSSNYQVKSRGKAFRYGKLLINGLPRNDIFFDHSLINESLGCDNRVIDACKQFKNQGLSIITYTPTWRKFDDTVGQLDLEAVNNYARKNQFIFVIKMHYKHETKSDIKGLSYIIEYEKTSDVYPLLFCTDLLITDYSSIYFDFLILDKPIIFYPYDIKEYSSMERELLLDYESITPGPKCYKQSCLEEEIYNHLWGKKDDFKLQRSKLRKQFFEYVDGKSNERLWHEIKNQLL